MRIHDIVVHYRGFQPTVESREVLQNVIDEIYEESPYGSTLRATFSRGGKQLKGVVHVTSPAGRFFTVATGQSVGEIAQKLMEQMRRRLDKWKGRRYRREHLRDHLRLSEFSVA